MIRADVSCFTADPVNNTCIKKFSIALWDLKNYIVYMLQILVTPITIFTVCHVKHQTSDMIAVRAKTETSSFKNLSKKTFQFHKQVNEKIKLQCSSLMMSSDDHQQVLGQEFKML